MISSPYRGDPLLSLLPKIIELVINASLQIGEVIQRLKCKIYKSVFQRIRSENCASYVCMYVHTALVRSQT